MWNPEMQILLRPTASKCMSPHMEFQPLLEKLVHNSIELLLGKQKRGSLNDHAALPGKQHIASTDYRRPPTDKATVVPMLQPQPWSRGTTKLIVYRFWAQHACRAEVADHCSALPPG